MTEDEAKKLWCPFARIRLDYDPELPVPAVNRQTDKRGEKSMPYYGTYCLGSGCMAWRWVPQTLEEYPSEGYCGLAGQPIASAVS